MRVEKILTRGAAIFTITTGAILSARTSPSNGQSPETKTPDTNSTVIVDYEKTIAFQGTTIARLKQTPKVSSFLQPPSIKNSKNESGLDQPLKGAYKEYIKKYLSTEGVLENGDIDFHIQMLSKPLGPNGLTRSHKPNFWTDSKEGGLGWTEDDAKFIYENMAELRAKPLPEVFSTSVDGIKRMEVTTEAKNVENAVAYGVIVTYLEKAGLLNASKETVSAYLSQENINEAIKRLTRSLIDSSGYKPTGDGEERTYDWPGAVVILSQDLNYLQNNGIVCVTSMSNATERSQQKEISTKTQYTQGLEKKTSGNDEKINESDSNGSVTVTLTYDPKGKDLVDQIRVDIVRISDYTDSLDKSNIPPADTIQEQVPEDRGRWIPCGPEGQKISVTIAATTRFIYKQTPQPPTPNKPTAMPTNVDRIPTATAGAAPKPESTATNIP